MNKINKIIIYIPDFRGGGAEKVYLNLANYWVEQGINVTFILNKKQGEYLELLNKKIKIINLNVSKIRQSFIKLPLILHKEKASICIAAMWPITSLTILIFKLFFIKTKLIVSDHVNLTKSIKAETNFNYLLFKLILKYTYFFADGIICVSEGVKNELIKISKLKNDKIKVIYNPIIHDHDKKKLNYYENYKKNSTKTIIAVGSLKEQKNHEMLIKSFSQINKNIRVKLLIIGSGPLKKYLNELIKSLNESDRVSIISFDKDIYKYYLQSHIFVLTSKWEGFGNVIVEALHCGLEVVSSDCDYGPREILENGKYGYLFKLNEENIFLNIIHTLLKKNDLSFNKKNFYKSFDFSVSKISKQYLDYMNEII